MKRPDIMQLDELLAAIVAADLSEAEVEVGDVCLSAERVRTGRIVDTAVNVPEPGEPRPSLHQVRALMVGYYRAPESPIAPGDTVSRGTLLGSIVSLGLHNEIRSDIDGVVVEAPLADGQPVEYGQLIVSIRPKEEAAE
ncbi:MAG: hypothetical protein HRF45_00720 [Fimbriimonadia bacterium]|jgi:biotin carboxyl carrier protein